METISTPAPPPPPPTHSAFMEFPLVAGALAWTSGAYKMSTPMHPQGGACAHRAGLWRTPLPQVGWLAGSVGGCVGGWVKKKCTEHRPPILEPFANLYLFPKPMLSDVGGCLDWLGLSPNDILRGFRVPPSLFFWHVFIPFSSMEVSATWLWIMAEIPAEEPNLAQDRRTRICVGRTVK